jgi:hypothetical protein
MIAAAADYIVMRRTTGGHLASVTTYLLVTARVAAAVFLASLRKGQAMAVYAAWLRWAQASSEIAMSRAATETAVAASGSTLRGG